MFEKLVTVSDGVTVDSVTKLRPVNLCLRGALISGVWLSGVCLVSATDSVHVSQA